MPFHPPPLAHVECSVLRADARLAALPHVAESISAFVAAPSLKTLVRTAASRSAPLFVHVAFRVMANATLDPVVRTHSFAQAMGTAIKNNDLTTVQRIHEMHPNELQVRSLELALQFGSLEMVQWVVETRHDMLCCPPGLRNLCCICLGTAMPPVVKDPRVAKWFIVDNGNDVLQFFGLAVQSVEVVRWCDERGLVSHGFARLLLVQAIAAATPEAVDVVRFLLTKVSSIRTYQLCDALNVASCQRGLEEAIERVLESPLCDAFRDKFVYAARRPGGAKVLQWDDAFMNTRGFGAQWQRFVDKIKYNTSRNLHLDTLQWLYYERGIVPHFSAVDTPPSEQEFLSVVKWTHEAALPSSIHEEVNVAAQYGFLETLEWLYQHCKTTGVDDSVVMDLAATHGHFHIIKWLHERQVNLVNFSTTMIMLSAASNGQLDLLVWLDKKYGDGCLRCVKDGVLQLKNHDAGRDVPVLHVLQWLDENARAVGGCTKTCVDAGSWWGLAPSAAQFGNVGVLQYLDEHHPSLMADPDDIGLCCALAASAGHVGSFQWLLDHQDEHSDWRSARIEAEAYEHAHVLEWLEGVATAASVIRDERNGDLPSQWGRK